jgi:hypothetical protein
MTTQQEQLFDDFCKHLARKLEIFSVDSVVTEALSLCDAKIVKVTHMRVTGEEILNAFRVKYGSGFDNLPSRIKLSFSDVFQAGYLAGVTRDDNA